MHQINKIVIHCSATANGKALGSERQTAAQVIDGWHANRSFKRQPTYRKQFNPHLSAIGYHYVIDTDGTISTGRAENETGAHVKGHNLNSLGICLVGGVGVGAEKHHGRYTKAQWLSLHELIQNLSTRYPNARLCGHRDLSPDLNGDGKITPNEWQKVCPSFSVSSWLDVGEIVYQEHLFKG